MPIFRASIELYGHIDVEAEDMFHADRIVRDMSRNEMDNRLVIDEIDTDLDTYPEEIG